MLKSFEEVRGSGGIQSEALWNIARELSRKNDLLEVEMLCKTADALRASVKSPPGNFNDPGYVMAEELAYAAHAKIKAICETTKDGD